MISIIKQLEEKRDSLNIKFYKPVSKEEVGQFEKEYIAIPTEYLALLYLGWVENPPICCNNC